MVVNCDVEKVRLRTRVAACAPTELRAMRKLGDEHAKRHGSQGCARQPKDGACVTNAMLEHGKSSRSDYPKCVLCPRSQG